MTVTAVRHPTAASRAALPAEPYANLYRRLPRIVRADVGAEAPVIEDACQAAWSRLLRREDRLDGDQALGWLARTARHEAYRQVERDGRESSLDALLEEAPGGQSGQISRMAPDPHECIVDRERLAALARLPKRQRRVLWLHALGYSYAEIAAWTGDSLRTVERQLRRARDGVRAAEEAA